MEISFNCLEEAESNIPVSPLHLAVSEQASNCQHAVLHSRKCNATPRVVAGVLRPLRCSATAGGDAGESGREGRGGKNGAPPGSAQGLCLVCGIAAETSGVLQSQRAQAKVDGSPRCRCVRACMCVHACVCVWMPFTGK